MKHLFSALALMALTAPAAMAHVTFENREVTQDTTARMVARIPHGCDGEPMLRLRIQIPQGVVSVKPMPKAGWTLTTVTGAYDSPVQVGDSTLTEGVREIVWEGELSDAHYDEFIFRARFTRDLPAGQKLFVPIVQECPTKAERWIEIPAEGQDPHALDYPAPGVMILPAAQ